ncbi:MAG: hypothetical protein AABO57_03140 [Acidobacteriota bacterium]
MTTASFTNIRVGGNRDYGFLDERAPAPDVVVLAGMLSTAALVSR